MNDEYTASNVQPGLWMVRWYNDEKYPNAYVESLISGAELLTVAQAIDAAIKRGSWA